VPLALQVAEETGLLAATPQRQLAAFCADLCSVATAVLTDHERFTPEQRDIAGRLLGGGPFPGHDTRQGVGIRPDGLPDIAWVKIEDRHVPGTSEVPGTSPRIFWIAKYPVTYAQYRAFLEADDGFRNDRWWREPTPLVFPEGQRDAPGRQRFPYWNHPAENVGWYDAIAFCRWLTAQVKAKVEVKAAGWEALLPRELLGSPDWKITLPTEWQWEKAARGHDGRQFPWGPEYKQGYANIDETYGRSKVGPHYLQKTSAVGMYPQGASPYGVLDLSGNVWEWCLNEYEKPERIQEEGDAWRVLRGGSWNLKVGSASALARNRNWNNHRNDNYGFRVVVVRSSTFFRPFSGGHDGRLSGYRNHGRPAHHSRPGSGSVGSPRPSGPPTEAKEKKGAGLAWSAPVVNVLPVSSTVVCYLP